MQIQGIKSSPKVLHSDFASLYQHIAADTAGKRAYALATVIQCRGSTPQKPGAKALVYEDGAFLGTLGGGMIEAEGLRRAREALGSGGLERFSVSLNEAYSRDAGPICGGNMEIFINPRIAAERAVLREAMRSVEAGEGGVLATQLDSGALRFVAEAYLDTQQANLPAATEIRGAFAAEEPCYVDANGAAYLLEPLVPPPRLLIVGGGHCGRAIAECAAWAGFDVAVLDDREDLVREDALPAGVRGISGPVKEQVAAFPKMHNTYIVIVTRGHGSDAEALEGCIDADIKYLGMIGSKRKVASLRKHFIEEKLATEAQWRRMYTPIGLDLGAVSVSEIAISVVAELVAVRRGGGAVQKASMKWTQ